MYKPSLFSTLSATIQQLKDKKKWSTAEHYASLLNSLKRFRKGKDMRIQNITRQTVEAYQDFLLAGGLSRNSVSFYLRMLRATYNRIVEECQLEDLKPFKKAITNNQRTLKRAIALEHIKRIAKLELSDSPRLQTARDIFMFLFYTRGMSLIDAAYLRKSDIKDGVLYYQRKKTGRILSIQWEREMQEIAERYDDPDSPYILPMLNAQKDSHRDYKSCICRINRNLQQVGKMAQVSARLTTYVSRHSWASIARDKNVPIAVISEGMGHNSMATTQIYLSSINMNDVHKANASIIQALV